MNRIGSAPSLAPWPNHFHGLGPGFFTELDARGLPNPHWVAQSPSCAAALGWRAEWWQAPDHEALAVFSGNALWPGMQPLASVYSGHQFGAWAGQLGDGRALLLGQTEGPHGLMELQLKGTGLTPYSRMGDGRAVLRSSIREFLCSEAMHALGIPSTRALCITGSALPVRRESVETAAVVARVATSFVRFGHFEHFTHTQPNVQALRRLADFCIEHHWPHLLGQADRYAQWLRDIAQRTARLMAQWQCVGFCHGVMNTDNMSILGLTLDYGPFGFMDAFDPNHICNHTDTQGRYAYARQPQVAFWNLHALAHALLPLFMPGPDDGAAAAQPDEAIQEATQEAALEAIGAYKDAFQTAMLAGLRAKLGLQQSLEEDRELADDWLKLMAAERVDFSIAFRRLSRHTSAGLAKAAASSAVSHALGQAQVPGHAGGHTAGPVRDLFINGAAFDAWAQRYEQRLAKEASVDGARHARMLKANPKYLLRNHLAQNAIALAEEGDFSETQRLHALLEHPFDEQPQHEAYANFPPDWARTLEVSCSS